MKPLRELSTEQIEELTDDELIELVANDIQSSRAGGADLEEEHVALAPWLAKATRALWHEEKEWRAAQAKPKTYRRYPKAGASFLGLRHNLEMLNRKKTTRDLGSLLKMIWRNLKKDLKNWRQKRRV